MKNWIEGTSRKMIIRYSTLCLLTFALCNPKAKEKRLGTLVTSLGCSGCRHSSVDSSVLSLLPPRVRVTSAPSTLFSIYIVQIVYLSFGLEWEKNENKQKKAGIGPFKKQVWAVFR